MAQEFQGGPETRIAAVKFDNYILPARLVFLLFAIYHTCCWYVTTNFDTVNSVFSLTAPNY